MTLTWTDSKGRKRRASFNTWDALLDEAYFQHRKALRAADRFLREVDDALWEIFDKQSKQQ